jgi:hypothetical protein
MKLKEKNETYYFQRFFILLYLLEKFKKIKPQTSQDYSLFSCLSRLWNYKYKNKLNHEFDFFQDQKKILLNLMDYLSELKWRSNKKIRAFLRIKRMAFNCPPLFDFW